MRIGADSAIDNIGQGSTIEHAHIILVLKALGLIARHTLCHCLVPYVYRLVYIWGVLECVLHGERIHFKAQANKLDDQIAVGLVFKVA